MDTFTATMIAEGAQETESREEFVAAWQHLIDTGVCWQLQGWFGRTASTLIENEVCTPA
jgi:hypothetical protein